MSIEPAAAGPGASEWKAFARLPEAEQARALAATGAATLPAWGLEGATLSLLKYRENAVFRVDRAGEPPRVLRVHRAGYRSAEEIRSEVAWMRALEAVGVETPRMYPTRAGDVVATARASGAPGERWCDLQEWVPGAPLGSLEGGVAGGPEELRRLYARVGRVAAMLHRHAQGWRRPPSFVRPRWDVEALVGERPTFGAFWELPELAPETRRVLLEARDRLREELAALGPPTLLVHGDLIPDNLLGAEDAVRVIDFDDCGDSWAGFELATSLFPLSLSDGFEPALAGWLAGYREVIPFPDRELELLPALLLARGLSYLGWPLGRPEIASQRPMVPLLAGALEQRARSLLSVPSG